VKFKVNWNLDTGAKQHKPGDVVEMKDKDAEPLVASGVLTPIGKVAATEGTDGQGTDVAQNAGGTGTTD